MDTSTKSNSPPKKPSPTLARQLHQLERMVTRQTTFAKTFDLYDSLWPTEEFWDVSSDTELSEELASVLKLVGESLGARAMKILPCFEIASHGLVHGSAYFGNRLSLFFCFKGVATAMVGVLDPDSGQVLYHRLSMVAVPPAPAWLAPHVGRA